MNLPGILAPLGSKIVDVVDQLVPDKDLNQKLSNELQTAIINSEADVTRAAADVIVAEAQGESWLQRNWRPLLMLFFAVLIGAYWFGYTPPHLPEEIIASLFELVKIGVGGYVIGRSGEKIAKQVAPWIKK